MSSLRPEAPWAAARLSRDVPMPSRSVPVIPCSRSRDRDSAFQIRRKRPKPFPANAPDRDDLYASSRPALLPVDDPRGVARVHQKESLQADLLGGTCYLALS